MIFVILLTFLSLICLFCVLAVLILLVVGYKVIKNKPEEKKTSEIVCPFAATAIKEVASAVEEKIVEETIVEEPVVEEQPIVEEPVVEEQPIVEEPKVVEEDDASQDADDDDRERARRIPFAEKMLYIDRKTQEYYDAIYNEFISYRRINPRVSSKGVSFRLGRELVAKLTVRGKTMKMHLALDVKDFEENIYFQKDLSDVKAYEEVPFTVKVKSDRGLKNALKLIDALVAKKAIEKKTRFNKVEAVEELKEIARNLK